ncbi:MAG: NAD(P)-dependent oxidoreductase [Betaproteobacteria bacterium]|nr:NAD(P)-dependent oxidoreductase [Betaproteobacteria bacterium]
MLDRFAINAADFDGPVLVTGAGGCIGSWAVALLARAGVQVAVFDLTEDKRRPGLLMSDTQLARVRWLTGDIADTKSVMLAAEASQARAIIHLAALQVPFCKADPVAGARVNVVGTVNVLEAARKHTIKRIAYASSVAALGAIEDGALPTLYGAYKYCDEQIARVYWQDWGVPSIGIRPGVVYGVGRDQGMSSKTTVAILAAAAGKPYTIAYRGGVSWLHAGECAAAFIRAIAAERSGAPVFNMNGVYAPVEEGVRILKRIVPDAQIDVTGEPIAFPMDRSDDPLRAHLGDYGSVPLEEGIRDAYESFKRLLAAGKLSAERLD